MLHSLIVAAVALSAAFCYAASNVIEQRKASAAPPQTSMRIALLWYLAHQPIWWLGVGVDLGGFGLQAVALGLGSLLFVQPLLVTSLLFSLALGALVGSNRLPWVDVGWALVFAGGLTVFLVVASPSGGVDQRSPKAWILPIAIVAATVALSVLLANRVSGAWRAAFLAAAAGITFGVSSTLIKSFAHVLGADGVGALFASWELYALAGVLALGFLILQSAFQAGDLRAALPAAETAEPVVASILGLTLMHERLHASTPAAKVVVAVAVVLMFASAVLLARSAARDRMAGARDADDGAGAPSTVPDGSTPGDHVG
jgi:hypothetical protein